MFDKIKKIIDKWDPIDLLALHCPKDEYHLEIKKIQRLLSETDDSDELAEGIFKVFTESFGEETFNKSKGECAVIAKKILKRKKSGKNAMKNKVLSVVAVTIVVVISVAVIYSLNRGDNKPSNTAGVTELTDYSILADYNKKFQVDNEWQLSILGENVTKYIPVILVTEDETVWKAVPLIAVLKELGVEVTWKDENTAVLVNEDNKLYLDLNTKTIHYKNDEFNLLKTPTGGKYYYEFVNNEVVVSGSCMNAICQFLGIHTCYDIKSDEKTVEITQYAS